VVGVSDAGSGKGSKPRLIIGLCSSLTGITGLMDVRRGSCKVRERDFDIVDDNVTVSFR